MQAGGSRSTDLHCVPGIFTKEVALILVFLSIVVVRVLAAATSAARDDALLPEALLLLHLVALRHLHVQVRLQLLQCVVEAALCAYGEYTRRIAIMHARRNAP